MNADTDLGFNSLTPFIYHLLDLFVKQACKHYLAEIHVVTHTLE